MKVSRRNTIRWDQTADGIVCLTLDDPEQSANTMNEAYKASMRAVLDRLHAERELIGGVVVTSAKPTFFAGGDLRELQAVGPEDAAGFKRHIRELKSQLRELETLGCPVVAAINGTALGGGDCARVPSPDSCMLDDVAVPPSALVELLDGIARVADRLDLTIGTFGHAGEGNLHPTIVFDHRDDIAVHRTRDAFSSIIALAHSLGGTATGEHGVGSLKRATMAEEVGAALPLHRAIKSALDPRGLFNPGKAIA